ncbi:MAG: hypothetical protein RL017_33, partial [Pseudomonadota bacterium]
MKNAIATKNIKINNIFLCSSLILLGLLLPTTNSYAQVNDEPPGTSFLNPYNVLGNNQDSSWLEDNIPLIEVPSNYNSIAQVYYYRWETYHEHLVYTSTEYGYLSSEFLQPVSYGAPYGGVNAAAGHHINEGRWLRDSQYDKDVINYWLSGPGVFPKAQNDFLGTGVDWSHEYAFWAASAVWNFYLATGDSAFAISQLNNLISQYQKWSNLYDSSIGMYYIAPVWEASEYSPTGYQLEPGDPYHGGISYRPLINSVMYGEAKAIANIAQLAGKSDIQTQYTALANQLQASVNKQMWDSGGNFFYPIGKGGSTQGVKVTTRELFGYAPWAFYLAYAGEDAAWAPYLNSTSGFAAAYGPRSAEHSSPWYWRDAGSCCHWTGPQWPYVSSLALTALANYLDDYQKVSPVITATDYINSFMQYTASMFKNGKPYVAEAHDPDLNQWDYDTTNHSEDYNHSTYNDNVISGLFGIRAQADNTVIIQPLIPETWPYFIIENVPYHGHNLTVLWDQDGTRYYQGAGLHVYVDGKQVAQQAHLTPKLQVNVGPAIVADDSNNLVDIAINSQKNSYLTQTTATFAGSTSAGDSPANVVSGIVYRLGVPQNSRWTTYGSSNSSDTLTLSFTYPVLVQQIIINFYDDRSINGAVRVPTNYYLCTTTPCTANNQITEQIRGSTGLNTSTVINLMSPVYTSNLYLSAANSPAPWGVSRFQVMSNRSFVIRNVNSNLALGSPNSGSMIVQQSGNDLPDTRWILQTVPGNWFKIINANTGMLLTVPGGSSQLSLAMQMQPDANSDSQLWRVMDYNANGQFRIFNKASNLLLGVAGMSKSIGSSVVQYSDSGTTDHLWQIIPAASLADSLQPLNSLANKVVNIVNFNSHKAINYNASYAPNLTQLAVDSSN